MLSWSRSSHRVTSLPLLPSCAVITLFFLHQPSPQPPEGGGRGGHPPVLSLGCCLRGVPPSAHCDGYLGQKGPGGGGHVRHGAADGPRLRGDGRRAPALLSPAGAGCSLRVLCMVSPAFPSVWRVLRFTASYPLHATDASGAKRFGNIFSHIVVDEAGQATEPEVISGIGYFPPPRPRHPIRRRLEGGDGRWDRSAASRVPSSHLAPRGPCAGAVRRGAPRPPEGPNTARRRPPPAGPSAGVAAGAEARLGHFYHREADVAARRATAMRQCERALCFVRRVFSALLTAAILRLNLSPLRCGSGGWRFRRRPRTGISGRRGCCVTHRQQGFIARGHSSRRHRRRRLQQRRGRRRRGRRRRACRWRGRRTTRPSCSCRRRRPTAPARPGGVPSGFRDDAHAELPQPRGARAPAEQALLWRGAGGGRGQGAGVRLLRLAGARRLGRRVSPPHEAITSARSPRILPTDVHLRKKTDLSPLAVAARPSAQGLTPAARATPGGFPLLFHGVEGEDQREAQSPSWFNGEEALVRWGIRTVTQHGPPPNPALVPHAGPYNSGCRGAAAAIELCFTDVCFTTCMHPCRYPAGGAGACQVGALAPWGAAQPGAAGRREPVPQAGGEPS